MKQIFLCFFLWQFVGFGFSQKWELQNTLNLSDSSQHWVLDEWEQLYQWKHNDVSVQNTQTKQLLRESFKSFGEITGIYPINGLRSLIFSEEQQLIGILDNTLQLKGTAINLSEHGFSYVSAVAKCARPDFIWIFDQYRSRLVLFNLQTLQSTQVIDNAFGNIFNPQILQLFEYQNNLYCLLKTGQLFQFDRNLTRIDQTQISAEFRVFCAYNQLWLANTFEFKQLKSNEVGITHDFPFGLHFLSQVFNDHFYFQSGDKIYVYAFKL
ncbi:MAG: hypothetical protein ACKOBN_00550 [Flavobacteriales bacterium]